MQAACFSGVVPAKSCQHNKFEGVQMPKDITKFIQESVRKTVIYTNKVL